MIKTAGFPTSSDIYVEVDGKKVAVVQSYTARTSKTSRQVEAFGEDEPIATIGVQKKHELELSRLYATDSAIRDGINFHELDGFSIVISKPDKRVIYTDCRWKDITESGRLNEMVLEKVSLVASKRIETSGK